MEGTERIGSSPAKNLHSKRNKQLVSCYQGVSMKGQPARVGPILSSISSRTRPFDLVKQSSTSVVNDNLHAQNTEAFRLNTFTMMPDKWKIVRL